MVDPNVHISEYMWQNKPLANVNTKDPITTDLERTASAIERLLSAQSNIVRRLIEDHGRVSILHSCNIIC